MINQAETVDIQSEWTCSLSSPGILFPVFSGHRTEWRRARVRPNSESSLHLLVGLIATTPAPRSVALFIPKLLISLLVWGVSPERPGQRH
ncbi:hypothetical protein PoB_001097600 [Plakobranchus ocellatus]|uniref:Uncharacterized protein n=1 Tax=Plakobranchus ocellatus TaxID=259542 RepID=A0AAV3YAX4_9GAST|nr:hypothetical protein PoB_001097600 [Plakobranchus ocellatus]